MKMIFCLLLASSIALSASCQQFSVAAEKMNVVYSGFDNPLTIVVQGYPNNKLRITTNNGIITWDSVNNQYNLIPDVPGNMANIIIEAKHHKKFKLIGQANFRVKRFPDPIFKIGPSAGGKIQKKVFTAQEYVRAEYENMDIDARASVDSFDVSISRNDSTIFTMRNYTNKIDSSIRAAFQDMKVGDEVQFYNIRCKCPDQTERYIYDAVFTMAE